MFADSGNNNFIICTFKVKKQSLKEERTNESALGKDKEEANKEEKRKNKTKKKDFNGGDGKKKNKINFKS